MLVRSDKPQLRGIGDVGNILGIDIYTCNLTVVDDLLLESLRLLDGDRLGRAGEDLLGATIRRERQYGILVEGRARNERTLDIVAAVTAVAVVAHGEDTVVAVVEFGLQYEVRGAAVVILRRVALPVGYVLGIFDLLGRGVDNIDDNVLDRVLGLRTEHRPSGASRGAAVGVGYGKSYDLSRVFRADAVARIIFRAGVEGQKADCGRRQ